MFGHVVGDAAHGIPGMILSESGEIAKRYLGNISIVYSGIKLDSFMIMPNHVHFIISVCDLDKPGGRGRPHPTIPNIERGTGLHMRLRRTSSA